MEEGYSRCETLNELESFIRASSLVYGALSEVEAEQIGRVLGGLRLDARVKRGPALATPPLPVVFLPLPGPNKGFLTQPAKNESDGVYADQLDRPWAIANAASQIRWRWDTSPFGESAASENPSGLGAFKFNLRFPGQYRDAETGLFYNYFRDYDPQTGRYVQSDPPPF